MRDSMWRDRFLAKSVRGRRLASCLRFGYIAILLVCAAAIAGLLWLNLKAAESHAREAERNAAEYVEVRNNMDLINRRLEDANRLIEQALVLQREGKSNQADALVKQAQQVQEEKAGSALTASELSELDRLRRQETTWRQTEVDLRKQLAMAQTATPNPLTCRGRAEIGPDAAERGELDRLRSAESNWERDSAQLRQQARRGQ